MRLQIQTEQDLRCEETVMRKTNVCQRLLERQYYAMDRTGTFHQPPSQSKEKVDSRLSK